MESSKIMMFPEMGANNGIDPNLLLALNNNGGFGNNGGWFWILFLWLIWGAGGNGWGNNGFGGNAAGFLSNQMNNDTGRELLMNAIQGNRDSINSLANLLNTEVSTVQNGIFTLNNAITSVGTQVGMSGLQIQNAIQAGNAAIASQICQCCCENRLAICQQTNTLQNQAERDTNSIIAAINAQTVAMNDKFCELKEREMQNKIDTQGDIITQLRNQISNDQQTLQFNNAFHALDDKIDAIKAAQPNTVPVQWPNIQAVNTTPFAGGFYGYNNGWGSNSFWN